MTSRLLDEVYDRLLSSDLNCTVIVDLTDPLLRQLRDDEITVSNTLLRPASNIAAQLWTIQVSVCTQTFTRRARVSSCMLVALRLSKAVT